MAILRLLRSTLPLLVIASSSMGQSGGMEIQDHLLIRESRRFSHDNEQPRFEGSPYENDQFRSANVHSGDVKFRAVPMRYNIAEDVMEFQVAGTTYLRGPDPKIARIDIGDETYIVPKSHRSFYVAHVMGNLSLLSKSIVNLRPANDLMGIPAKYGRQPDAYYLVQANNPPAKVTGLKNFLELIPDKAEQVEKYARSEKISFKKESDLKKLVEYVNTLKDL